MLEKIMKKFKISQNKLNVMRLSGGTLIGQLISVITIPIATRIFSVSVISDWTILQATATMANAISSLGLLNAVVVKDTDKESEDVVTAVSTLGMTFGIFVLCFKCYRQCLNQLQGHCFSLLSAFFKLFLLSLIFHIPNILYCFNNRKKQ